VLARAAAGPMKALSLDSYYNSLDSERNPTFRSYPSFAEVGGAPDIIIAKPDPTLPPPSEAAAKLHNIYRHPLGTPIPSLIPAEVSAAGPLRVTSLEEAAQYAGHRKSHGNCVPHARSIRWSDCVCVYVQVSSSAPFCCKPM
jgi:hypothetical protein